MISCCSKEKFVLGLHKVDKILGAGDEEIAVFTFDTKDLRPVHDFIADQFFWKKSKILLLKMKGYLRKKFSERFESVNASLTCFASLDREVLDLARKGIIEEDKDGCHTNTTMKTYD